MANAIMFYLGVLYVSALVVAIAAVSATFVVKRYETERILWKICYYALGATVTALLGFTSISDLTGITCVTLP